jgi:hypothetical protein
MKVNGACHCGRLKFEAEIDPGKVSICHCTDCQVMGGSAFRTGVPVEDGTFRMISGEPKIYTKTTAESGAKRLQAFCPECGTAIYTTTRLEEPRPYRVRVGVLEQRDQLPPRHQFWQRSAHSWLKDIGTISSRAKQ